ncbi:uncharacterized protein MONOS_1048 [Monocercomonoides exilis]|uniref:uncharacterized protein n=1 Tax=Monocercomonoides exilis TaxID=2049356 RepID=UPI00355A76C1|nr:hypothetical protein MONOS_1048 [Monocercomonoides exilis]|eukprot:MONOS_1048.1-p1 / transcript=MONOS_1048.1 / gene=MONOS_1048 / organism=Monocercomonoides_exilis_PA203 / gene_product=unspecified product / transcript_product=unspecified product / location=Mono_scaffold00017:236657-237238(-) / protein_length=149 / sequence_SO=supercontig / SO=protein_coding / is_pseudo=false
MSFTTDFTTESGHTSAELRPFSRSYTPGAKIGNWFEDYSQSNRSCGFMTTSPAFRTMYQEQTKHIADRCYSTTDRSFVHPLPVDGFPKSEYGDNFVKPTEMKPRQFRSERHFERDKAKIEEYTQHWTTGKLGDTQYHTAHRDFSKHKK